MQRAYATIDYLNQYLTHRFLQRTGLRDAHLQISGPLNEPDEMGCNWSDQISISTKGFRINDKQKQEAILVCHQAREQFNVFRYA